MADSPAAFAFHEMQKDHRLSDVLALVVVVHGLSCPVAHGIFPDQKTLPESPALAGRFLTTRPQAHSMAENREPRGTVEADLDPVEYTLRKRLPHRLPRRPNDIYVNMKTDFKAQLARCQKLLDGGARGQNACSEIYIHGLGLAINRAINIALQLQAGSFGSLQVAANTSTVELVDELEPETDSREPLTRIRNNSAIHIRVFRVTPKVLKSEEWEEKTPPNVLLCAPPILNSSTRTTPVSRRIGTMGCAEGCSFSENITVPDTKVNFYAWKRMEVQQQALEVWQGLALLSEAIFRGQALLANASQPCEALRLHVDKAVSGLRSLTSLLRALGAQKEAIPLPDATPSAAPLRIFTVDALSKLFRIYSNFLRGKLTLYTGEACRRGDRLPVDETDEAILTQCDFEDDSRPLCDWSQVTKDDGDWTRESRPSFASGTAPPGGYPSGEGYYLHMDSSAFHPGGVARLQSPAIWEQGPLCVRFAYYMFGLSWGAQLKLWLASGTKGKHPNLLWKHVNTQSPSWIPTAVTVPLGLVLPSRLTFEGVWGSTTYLDIALDAISIHRGSCNRVCLMQTCNFDTLKDLCGWSWISTASGAKWVQKKGPTGVLDVGPEGDFSSPGDGYYMLLDPKNAKASQKSVLLSPLIQSSGCLSLSFHYVLRGRSPGAGFTAYASVLGSIRKHTIFSGQPGPNWQPVSVNYTGQGQIQFTLVGVFAKIPEPAVAVDAISIAPCGESFPQCDFEDKDHPFCDWVQVLQDGGRWTQGSANTLIHGTGPFGISLSGESHFVYLEADKFSQEGQSYKLVSRPFCAPGAICVAFSYHMDGRGKGTKLRLLLGSPAGSPPSSLWERVGSQGPDWLNDSMAIPSGHQQPMQLMFEVERGSHAAFVVALGFIFISQGTCRAMCPPNAHYERCACPASCQSPKPACGLLCKPGCVCNSGFLFHDSRCINASSCDCFYNENYYKTGTEWFSPNCTERCRCQPGSQIECQPYKCGTHTVCQLKHGQYRCHPYGTATCFVYGDPHYSTFDGRYFNFRGKCTYLLAQPCGNSTEPFFRVTVKNEERGLEGVSCLSKVSVTLSETTITLLKGRHTLVGGQRVTLPAIPSGGVFLTPSGRFVQLQTAFGLRVRWDGDQQLYVRVPSPPLPMASRDPCPSVVPQMMETLTLHEPRSTYSSKLCGFCGNYDGDSSNDNKKPDGKPARDEKELGNSWQTSEDEDQAACLPHLRVSSFFDNCLLDMCNFQGLQQVLCTHMSALTETCQEAGYAVKPWRGPQFCPLACPPNSRYTLCAKLCPDTCHSSFSGMACQNRCVEGCECNPGFILSGLQCVPQSECGCLDPTAGYFKVGERWFKPGCRQLCICEGTNRTRCVPWQCQAQELCGQQDGTYGCHPQGSATCTVWGDPHYLTFDGALHHFMGTCTYILTRPCSLKSLENYFFVSATNEFRGGNLEASYVKAVQVQAFGIRVWMLKGRKVMLDGRQVALPLWFAHGRMTVRSSGSFILLYTDFGLQVRYDGYHLVEVTAPSSYAGRLCGMCGNYNNNSLDDNLQPDKRPAVNSVRLGASWKLNELSESGCFAADARPPRCLEKNATDPWSKNCDILVNPQGPFSRCHKVVAPQASFTSCVYGQCGTKGDTFTLCRSLQAYASLCARAGQVLTWRNSTFCRMGVCQIQDRSQYISFDGSYHAVQGACTYVLAKTCHSTMDLPFFKISGKNGQQQDQAHTSYLRKVYVHVFNTLVTLKKDHVLINGTWVPLPATSQIRGVSVISRDGYMVLTISIGVEVKFDGNGFLKIEIPKAYYGKTCGVCGNFNGEEEDELLMPNDELAPDDITYVDSWQDKEIDPSCQDDDKTEEESEKEPETTCQPADLERAQEQCQAAFQTPGWARCASRVILNPFLVRCTDSLCEFGGLSSTLCQSLQAFATACQAQGIRPPIWRNSSFCPLDCPPNYVYTNCFPHCPPTCDNPEGRCKGSSGPSNCEEGCVCEPGYVLKERRCVPRSQCGCRGARGRFLPEGNAWFSSSCSQRCTCRAGAIQCRAFACPASSRCETDEDGKEICKPYRSERCTVYGDPTYRTFDGLGYRFQGRMTYYLVKTVDVLPSGVEPFIVEGRNKMYASHNPIFLHEIIVMVYGYTVQLQHELELVVNGQKVTAPYEPVDQLRVSLRSDRLFVITDFELVVSFNGKNNAVISLPVTYRKLVLGLCGNCDQNKRNDFMLPNGAVTQNLLAFGNSWEVKMTEGSFPRISRAVQEEEVREEAALGFPGVSGCRPEELQLISRTQACGVLVDPEGPFAVCHQTVAPEPFLEHCVSDLCAAHDPKEQEELRCQVLSGYASICQEAGATPASWRDHTHCANTVYQSCMTPCPASCATLAAPRGCKGPCVEGCASLPGYIYSGAQSLPLAHCGCTNNGIYYQGDSFVNDDCSQRCTCARTGLLLCEPLGCSPGEVCTLGNLTRGCFRDSPCLQNPCQNDGRCREQGTHFTCECEPGYGGDRCMEPRDVPPPEKPGKNFTPDLYLTSSSPSPPTMATE
ncbi:hypothetical protein JEQ12_012659 [Ovis aries]|uniref:Erythropoietin n=1 Tax=Ovis aries TaxID=9940 RepID=A0A836CQQ4_SHEEP|nr:hypothetical protein JEQ12_012659 [Ovis aries]